MTALIEAELGADNREEVANSDPDGGIASLNTKEYGKADSVP